MIPRQQGVALIMVLLAMALVVLMASGMLHKQGLRIFKTQHYLSQQQGQSVALGAEIFAGRILKQDYEDDKESSNMSDHPEEIWAKYSAILPLDNNGVAEVQIDDLGGRINLNDLINEQGQVNQLTRERVERLLRVLGIIDVSVDALIDWVDPDQQTISAYGAEDGQYLVQDPSYRAANQPFSSVTELRLIAGMTEEAYDLLRPHLTVLPVQGLGINVNMASVEVLRSLHDGITGQQAEGLVSKRVDAPWNTVGDFLQEPEFSGMGLQATGLTVRTYFFEVVSRITVNDQSTSLVSKIFRSPQGELSTLGRDMSQKNRITKSPYTGE
ncbi:type II secretion system minor pseudopilin GspK [Marinobacter sp.]|uniref:type II secretion system minor pseudopilin GspK n=1 Tax=Marinobacter sp. TaxID=50741 RepID=UPI0025C15648|nr:type II secretion system minor pseudopilin GspK [Marinobacter sp.]